MPAADLRRKLADQRNPAAALGLLPAQLRQKLVDLLGGISSPFSQNLPRSSTVTLTPSSTPLISTAITSVAFL